MNPVISIPPGTWNDILPQKFCSSPESGWKADSYSFLAYHTCSSVVPGGSWWFLQIKTYIFEHVLQYWFEHTYIAQSDFWQHKVVGLKQHKILDLLPKRSVSVFQKMCFGPIWVEWNRYVASLMWIQFIQVWYKRDSYLIRDVWAETLATLLQLFIQQKTR